MLLRSIALLLALCGCVNSFVVPGNSLARDLSLNVETVRKKQFVADMAEELGYTQKDAEAALVCVLDMISNVSSVGFDCVSKGFFFIQIILCFYCHEWSCFYRNRRRVASILKQ